MKNILSKIIVIDLLLSLCIMAPPAGASMANLVILVDSSGSMLNNSANTDSERYANWQNELTAARALAALHMSANPNNAVSMINYSGNGSSYTYEQTIDPDSGNYYRIRQEFSFDDYPDAQSLDDRMAQFGPSDFIGGWTWHTEAVRKGYDDWLSSGRSGKTVFVLFTDGSPTSGHELADSTGYVSSDLQNLRDNDIDILTMGIGLSQSTIDDFFIPVSTGGTESFFNINNFSNFLDVYEERYLQQPVPTPIPSTALLMTMGILGAVWIGRRNQSFTRLNPKSGSNHVS